MASAQSAVGDPGTNPALSARAAALLARIDRDLPTLARELIPRSPSVSARFLDRPDDPGEHKPEWHQYGIITHTRQFVAALREAVPGALRRIDPAIAARADAYFAASLDDLTRWELLLVAGYWHDVGKFTTRTVGRRGDWRFIGHAHDSARLIAAGAAGGLGARYGLTVAQTAFVARLADLHYAPMELKLALDRGGGVPGTRSAPSSGPTASPKGTRPASAPSAPRSGSSWYRRCAPSMPQRGQRRIASRKTDRVGSADGDGQLIAPG